MSILVAKRNSKGERTSEPMEMKAEAASHDPAEAGLHSAAQDMISGMHEKSPHKVVDAMKSFITQHAGHKED